MEVSSIQKKSKKNISFIIDVIIKLINNQDLLFEDTEYYYNHAGRQSYLYYLYLLKLIINSNEYIAYKYKQYLLQIKRKLNEKTSIGEIPITKITNIDSKNVLDLIRKVKKNLLTSSFSLDLNKNQLSFNDEWIDLPWLCSFIALILDNPHPNKTHRDITICYTIPKRDVKKINSPDDLIEFLSHFIFFSIKVKYTDKTKEVKENNILIIKNAAINYLKHFKKYKYGLESEELYLVFYKLLKNECTKQGFVLEEEADKLTNVNVKYLKHISKCLPTNFYDYQLSKQVHIIENIIWQLTNDLTMLEYINSYFDSTLQFLTNAKIKQPKLTYNKLKKINNFQDIRILLILIIQKFSLQYLFNPEEIDYSLLDLTAFKPEYMNRICEEKEEKLKNQIKDLELEINSHKMAIDKCKHTRQNLNKYKLGPTQYQEELEKCVGEMNRASINIATLNSTMASLKKEYETLKKKHEEKYKNIELYNYNHSIIRHICNSISGCNFYLKTNNNNELMENIIIFEDYKKSDNTFYLEITFKELIKISNTSVITSIEEQIDLPKLAK